MPPARRHRLLISRDQHKFSCAHMTVFPDGSKERLHGHNYQVGLALDLTDIRFEAMIPFAPIKTALADLCAQWKERVLVAAKNPFYQSIRADEIEHEFRLCGERYVLPAADVLLLPIDNIAVEPLAAHLADLLGERLAAVFARPEVLGYEVTVSESPGQGASCTTALR